MMKREYEIPGMEILRVAYTAICSQSGYEDGVGFGDVE